MIINSDRFMVVLQSNVFGGNKKFAPLFKSWIDHNIDLINYWAYILHDKDILDNGDKKTPHYHIVLLFNKCVNKMSLINDLARFFIISKDAISVREIKSVRSSLLYLSHLKLSDDSTFSVIDNKHFYDIDDITMSDKHYYDDIVYGIVNLDLTSNLDIEALINLCAQTNSLIYIYRKIGLANAKKYRFIIKDLLDSSYTEFYKKEVKEDEK